MKRPDRSGAARPKGWWQTTPDGDVVGNGAPQSVQVFEPETGTVNTGLLDKDGNPIRRSVRKPIGFIRF